MKTWVVGLALVLGFLAGQTSGVLAATMEGSNGYLHHWEVRANNQTVCEDPYVRVSSKEIECE